MDDHKTDRHREKSEGINKEKQKEKIDIEEERKKNNGYGKLNKKEGNFFDKM